MEHSESIANVGQRISDVSYLSVLALTAKASSNFT